MIRLAQMRLLLVLALAQVSPIRAEAPAEPLEPPRTTILGYSADGRNIFASENGKLVAIDAATGRVVKRSSTPARPFPQALLPNRTQYVYFSKANEDDVLVRTSDTGEIVRRATVALPSCFYDFCIDDTATNFYIEDADQELARLRAFSLTSQKERWSMRHTNPTMVKFLRVSPEGRFILTGFVNELQIRDAHTGSMIKEQQYAGDDFAPRFGFIANNGKSIAVVGDHSSTPCKVRLLDSMRLSVLKEYEYLLTDDKEAVNCAAASADLSVVAVATHIDGRKKSNVRIWYPNEGSSRVFTCPGSPRWYSMHMARDGRQLLFAAHDMILALSLPERKPLWTAPSD